MIEKRKMPWGVFVIALVLLMVITYFGCGLLKIEGVTISNYQEKLIYIISHPLRNWWTDKTLWFV